MADIPRPQNLRKATEGSGTILGPQLTLPQDRQKTVEAGLLMFQEISAERDRLRRQVDELERKRAQDAVELEAMRTLISTLESRAASHQIERDKAVADRSIYEALFISIGAQLRAFNVPAAPLVRPIDDSELNQPDLMEKLEREIKQ